MKKVRVVELSGIAKEIFNEVVKELQIKDYMKHELAMGCFYYGEWCRLVQEGVEVSHEDKNTHTMRGTPEIRYLRECRQAWEECAKRFGLNLYHGRNMGKAHAPNAKTKRLTRVPLRKEMK